MKVLVKDLETMQRIYEPQGKTPELMAETADLHRKGDEVIAHDGGGNSVRCIVRRHMVVVVPDWETYNQGVHEGQGSILCFQADQQ